MIFQACIVRPGEAPPHVRDLAPTVLPRTWKPITSVPIDGREGLRWRCVSAQTVIMSVEDRSPGGLWWHVSTAFPNRLPTWREVIEVKELFMGPGVVALHLIPPRSSWINHHPFCLHIWVRLDGPTCPAELYA